MCKIEPTVGKASFLLPLLLLVISGCGGEPAEAPRGVDVLSAAIDSECVGRAEGSICGSSGCDTRVCKAGACVPDNDAAARCALRPLLTCSAGPSAQ